MQLTEVASIKVLNIAKEAKIEGYISQFVIVKYEDETGSVIATKVQNMWTM